MAVGRAGYAAMTSICRQHDINLVSFGVTVATSRSLWIDDVSAELAKLAHSLAQLAAFVVMLL